MILVTGAGGKVGRNLCQKLVSLELDFLQTQRGAKYESRGNLIYCDLRKIDHIKRIFESNSVSTLIHLAVTRNPLANPKIRSFECLSHDTKILLNLLQLSPELNKVAFISSAAVYGENKFPDIIERDKVSDRLIQFINESNMNSFQVEDVSEHCYKNLLIDPFSNKAENTRLNGTSKLINEMILRSYANENKIPVLVLRSFLIKTSKKEQIALEDQLQKLREDRRRCDGL